MKNFMWFVEEVGELARAIKSGNKKQIVDEVADVIAWLMTVANLLDIDVEKASEKYKKGCPRCQKIPCKCKF